MAVELEGYKNLRLIKYSNSVHNNISFNCVKGYESFSYNETKSKLSERAMSTFLVHEQVRGKDPATNICSSVHISQHILCVTLLLHVQI